MDVQRMVRDYHAKYHPTHGRMTPSTVEPELMTSRRAMWDEEVTEVDEAWTTYEEAGPLSRSIALAHLLHELADVVYVAYGTAERCGVELNDVINAVHRANMRKVPSTTGGKATKPVGWMPADEVIIELVRRADAPAPAALPFAQPSRTGAYTDRPDLTSGPGPVFTARFDSECGAACGDDLKEGDDARMFDGSAMHARCAENEAESG